jgi:hypothetical protein
MRAALDGNASLSVNERGVVDGSARCRSGAERDRHGDIVAKDRRCWAPGRRVARQRRYGVIEMAWVRRDHGDSFRPTPEAEASTPSAA